MRVKDIVLSILIVTIHEIHMQVEDKTNANK